MLNVKKLFVLAALSCANVALVAGCTADAGADDDEAIVEEADLTAAGKALIGSYKDDSGTFRGLILTATKAGQANEFIADVSTGIVCVTAPCPSEERITGTFTAGTKTITFKSSTASSHAKHVLGTYKYTVQGSKFSLQRKNFAQSLEKVTSYCAEANDCYAQSLIHPMCLGGFSCTAENTCKWSCGPNPINPCTGRSEEQCTSDVGCRPKYGPSACTPDGRICTADMAYKGCFPRPNTGKVCYASDTCAPGTHCSVEDGVCNSSGMLQVCSGTCVESP